MAQCSNCSKRLRDGFVFVSPIDESHPRPSYVHRRSRIFELAIEAGDDELERCICGKCTHDLVADVDQLIAETEACNASYIKFMTDGIDIPAETTELPVHTQHFEETIRVLKQKHVDQQRIIADLSDEDMQLKQEEERCWLEILDLNKQLQLNVENDHFTNETNNTIEEILHLDNVNVYADTFVIGVTQHGVGTINNLRLGRKPEEMVDWEEINAAWGQSVLLLSTLAKKLNLTFSKYRPIPMGARAFIQQKDQGGVMYPLHGSQTVTFNHGTPHFYEFWGSSASNSNSGFDNGLEAFLFCVSELCARAISLSATISLPYYIDKDKIGTKQALKSIKTSANNESDWSKALKYMLTNLKRILAYVPTNPEPSNPSM